MAIISTNTLYLSTDSGKTFTALIQSASICSFPYNGDFLYIGYNTELYIYDISSSTCTTIQTDLLYSIPACNPYIDTSGQYFMFLLQSTNDDILYSTNNYLQTLSSKAVVNSLVDIQINSTNNSFGKYLIMSLYNKTVSTTRSGFTNFRKETYFHNVGQITSVATNYCNTNNRPIAMCIGSTNPEPSSTYPIDIYMFYYGYQIPINSSNSTNSSLVK